MSRTLFLLTKICLSITLVWYALSKVDVGAAVVLLRSISPGFIVAVFVIFLVQYTIAALRLKELLRLLGANCRLHQAVDVIFIGAFFSQTMISFLGGDAMRVWRMTRTNIPFELSAQSVILDRAAGFLGLMILILWGMPFLAQSIPQPQLRWGLYALVLGGVGCFVLLFYVRRMPARLIRWRPLQWAANLSSAATSLLENKGGALSLICLSLTIHVLSVVILYVILVGLSIEVSFRDALILLPPVMFLSMLPISVAGWGVRESAMVIVLGFVGIPSSQSLALSICFGVCMLVVSLPGGALWFYTRSNYNTNTAITSIATNKKE